jgi:hypothetical protein
MVSAIEVLETANTDARRIDALMTDALRAPSCDG